MANQYGPRIRRNTNDPYDMLLDYIEFDKKETYLPKDYKLSSNSIKTANPFKKKKQEPKEVSNFGEGLMYLADSAIDGLVQGVGSAFGGASDFLAYAPDALGNSVVNAADKLGILNPVVSDSISKSIDKETSFEKFLKGAGEGFDILTDSVQPNYKTDNKFLKFGGDVASGLGGMAPTIAAGLVGGPGVANAALGASAGLQGFNTAFDESNDFGKALGYGAITGIAESQLEKLTGGAKLFGKGTLDDLVQQGISKLGSEGLKKGAKVGADLLGEGLEEYLSSIVDEYATDIYKPYEGNASNVLERFVEAQPEALYSGAVGSATAGLLNAPVYINNALANRKSNAGKVIDEKFLEENKTPINNKPAENVQSVEEPLAVPASEEIAPVEEPISQLAETQLPEVQFPQAQEPVADTFAAQAVNQELSIEEQLAKDLKSDDSMKRIVAENENRALIEKSGRECNVPEHIINEVWNVANSSRVAVRFVDKLQNNASGMYKNGVLYISAQSKEPVQEIFKHELTHHLEGTNSYQEFRNVALEILKKDLNLDVVRSNLKEAYKENSNGEVVLSDEDVDAEIVAMFSENRIFNDKNTIDDIARINVGVAEKIYNWIKEKLYSFIPGSKEKAMLLKAERLYRNAIDEAKKTTKSNEAKYKIDFKDYGLDNERYKYENLIKLPNIEVKTYKWEDYNGNESNHDYLMSVKNKALKDGARNSTEDENINYSFIVDRDNSEVLVTKKGLIHSKNKIFRNKKNLLNVHNNFVEIFKNAVKLNEATRDNKHAEILFNEVVFDDGNTKKECVVRFVVVENKESPNKKRLYAISVNEKNRRTITHHHPANAGDNDLGASAELSVANLIDDVNSIDVYKNDLPLDVYYRFNNEYKGKKSDIEGLKYSMELDLNKLDTSKHLKDIVAGYNTLNRSTGDQLKSLAPGEYRDGRLINDYLDLAAREVIKDNAISEQTKKDIIKTIEKNNMSRINDSYEYDTLVNFIGKKGILISNWDSDALQALNEYVDIGRRKDGRIRTGVQEINGVKFRIVENSNENTLDNEQFDSVYDELASMVSLPKGVTNSYDMVTNLINFAESSQPMHEKILSDEEIEEINKYNKDKIEQLLEDFEYAVIYRSNKSNYDAYARKLAKDKGKYTILSNREALGISDELEGSEEVLEKYLESGAEEYKELKSFVGMIENYDSPNKTISQINDVVANKMANIRKYLYKNTEEKVFDAGNDYSDNIVVALKKLQSIIKRYDIKPGSKESAALQRYGEGQYQVYTKGDVKDKNGKIKRAKIRAVEKYGMNELIKDIPDVNTRERIIECDKEIRAFYDEYVERINEMYSNIYTERSLTEEAEKRKDELMIEINALRKTLENLQKMKLKPDILAQITRVKRDIVSAERRLNNVDKDVRKNKRLERRSNYYHHYYEKGTFGALNEMLKGENNVVIANDLASISEFTKPKTKWQAWMQERDSDAPYTEDAIGGLLKYIQEAEYSIAFNPVISDLRNFNKALVKYSDEEQINNSNYIKFISDYTNSLAGKTNPIDRAVLNFSGGRKALQILKTLNNLAKRNAVQGNVRSAISQIFNLPNSMALISSNGGVNAPKDIAKGSNAYMNYLKEKMAGSKKTSDIEMSWFLKQRYLSKEFKPFDVSKLRKLSNMADFMMTVGDQGVAELTWFMAYEQGKRLKKADVVAYADDITRRAVGGRGVGELPLAQQSQIVKLLAPFQVEVQNTWNLTKSMVKGKQFSGILAMFFTSYLLNELVEPLTGNRVGMDLINAIIDAITNDEEEGFDKASSGVGRVAGEVLSNVPYANAVLPYVYDESQREQLFGESDPSRFGQVNLGVDLVAEPLYDLLEGNDIDYIGMASNLLPFGGKQVDRSLKYLRDKGILPKIDFNTKEGLKINTKEGAYTQNGELKYIIDDNPINNLKGLMFGSYSTKQGKEYLEGDYRPLNEKKTEAITKLSDKYNLDIQDVYEAMRGVSDIKGVPDLRNSKAAQVRKYLEEAELYSKIISGTKEDDLEVWGLSKTIKKMPRNEYQKLLNEIKRSK